jgi:hypothetical protein
MKGLVDRAACECEVQRSILVGNHRKHPMFVDEITQLSAWTTNEADGTSTLNIVGKIVAEKPCFASIVTVLPQDPSTPTQFAIKVETKEPDSGFCHSILWEIEFSHVEKNHSGSHNEIVAESARDLKVTTIASAKSPPKISDELLSVLSGDTNLDEVLEKQSLWRQPDEEDKPLGYVGNNATFVSNVELQEGDEITPFSAINIIEYNGIFRPDNLTNRRKVFYASGEPGTRAFLISERLPNTGGHHHGGASRDPNGAGQFDRRVILLGPNYPQNHPVFWTLPDVHGSIKIGAYFEQDGSFRGYIADLSMVDPLVAIPATSKLHLKAPTSTHPSPYWVTSAMAQRLTALANGYHARTGKHITCTDASLRDGGRFDYKATWRHPHAEHMWGEQADIRNFDQDAAERAIFVEECKKAGLAPADHGNHWHVRG